MLLQWVWLTNTGSGELYNVRMIVYKVLQNIDWIVLSLHSSLNAVKQVYISCNQ